MARASTGWARSRVAVSASSSKRVGQSASPGSPGAARHDRDLRDSIRLAAALGVNRLVALAGCPGASRHDHTPHFAAGGWLPYLEGIYEQEWERRVAPCWNSISEFARATHPDLLICLELHPGTAVYNVETFERVAELGANLAANVDPATSSGCRWTPWPSSTRSAAVSATCTPRTSSSIERCGPTGPARPSLAGTHCGGALEVRYRRGRS